MNIMFLSYVYSFFLPKKSQIHPPCQKANIRLSNLKCKENPRLAAYALRTYQICRRIPSNNSRVSPNVSDSLKSKANISYIEIGCDNGEKYEFKNRIEIQSHKIHFDGCPTKPVNIEYITVFGEIHGEYKLYDRSGKLMQCAYYKNGLLHGDTIDYNVNILQNNGNMKIVPKYIRSYENGVEVSVKTISYGQGGTRIFDE